MSARSSNTTKLLTRGLLAVAAPLFFLAIPAHAQDSAVYTQCEDSTVLHPTGDGIKCMHLSGGDGMVTMADGEPIYIFSFAEIPMPGTEIPDGGSWNGSTSAPSVESGLYPAFAMEYGLLAANAPAPTIEVNEDDELFLTLTNVGMALRPDLFDPHTVHWHGFPQASSVFDGVPDASIAINMGASLTYYYNVKDAGTYMYHCHVEATEHMQMGMLGNLFVHPRQDRLGAGDSLYDYFVGAGAFAGNGNAAYVGNGGLTPAPAPNTAAHVAGATYAYNDGDGTTRFDVEFPIQIGSFDKAFHDASYTVQPLPFASMRDTYFMLNGRGYPDTVEADNAITTGGENRQPVSSLIEATSGDRILLRISNLNVTQFNTIGTNGPPMEVVALDARLLRADDGTNMYYKTNSVTLGGGQSADVIIDTTGLTSGTTFFLYSTNLEMLANHHDNFGGMMTEIQIN
jgi:FtsP/CotA-like multicopper oxidase with cupredoxin domain